MVEYSITSSRISWALNFTFIYFIHNNLNPSSFNYFTPISLWQLVYKLIVKIISSRIKYQLSRNISIENFGFLSNRHILNGVCVSQEGMHSIKVNNLNSILLNLDIVKPYDNVDWRLLILLLLYIRLAWRLQIGLWIVFHL